MLLGCLGSPTLVEDLNLFYHINTLSWDPKSFSHNIPLKNRPLKIFLLLFTRFQQILFIWVHLCSSLFLGHIALCFMTQPPKRQERNPMGYKTHGQTKGP